MSHTEGVLLIGRTDTIDTIDTIDKSITLEGRFGTQLFFHLPTKDDIMQIIAHIFNENNTSYESDISVLASHFEGKNVASIKKFFAEYFKFMTKNKIKTFNHHSIGMFINEQIT